MKEFYRVIFNRKTIIFLSIIILLNLSFYMYQCNDQMAITLQGEELEDYISSYPTFLKNIEENVSNMKLLQIYQKETSYVNRNLVRTLSDYQNLEGITLVAGENRGIVAFLSFHLTDLLLLAVSIYLVLQFVAEQKKGLHYLVRSTAKGRFSLCCKRIGILIVSMIVITTLLYGSSLLVSWVHYGTTALSRPLQSVPEFMHCTLPITIGEYFIINLLLKITAGTLLSLLLYILLGMFRQMIAFAIFIAIFVFEYLAYELFLPTGRFLLLKFINLYTLLRTEDFFTQYYNMNLFGHAVPSLQVIASLSILLLPILVVLCLIVHGKRYLLMEVSRPLMIDRILKVISQHARQLPMFVWEGRKIFFNEKGILFFILIFYLAYSSAHSQQYLYPLDGYELKWYETYNAAIDESLMEQINAEYTKLSVKLEKLYKNYSDFQEELYRYSSSDSRYKNIKAALDKVEEKVHIYEMKVNSLAIVKSEAESGYAYHKATGKELYLIKPYSYQLLFVDDEKTLQKSSTYILLAMITIFAGIIAYEKTTHMDQSLRAFKRGRNSLLFQKILWIFIISFLVAVPIHMLQVIKIQNLLGYHDMTVPVQSIACMRDFPLSISIHSFFILLFLLRGFATFLIGIIVLCISQLCSDTLSSIAVSIFLLVIPSVIDSMNLLPFHFVSPTEFIGVIQLLTTGVHIGL